MLLCYTAPAAADGKSQLKVELRDSSRSNDINIKQISNHQVLAADQTEKRVEQSSQFALYVNLAAGREQCHPHSI